MFKIKKTFEVAIAHRLDLPYESKCSRFHGHNLTIAVYCASKDLDENGMVIDFTLVRKLIHDVIDHSSLSNINCSVCGNCVVASSLDRDDTPTAEKMAEWICMKIDKCYRVDVQESKGNVASYIDDSVRK